MGQVVFTRPLPQGTPNFAVLGITVSEACWCRRHGQHQSCMTPGFSSRRKQGAVTMRQGGAQDGPGCQKQFYCCIVQTEGPNAGRRLQTIVVQFCYRSRAGCQ